MEKIKASILVIGFQKEDGRMYPHLYDFLQDLRGAYADVIYIGDDDRGHRLYAIDRTVRDILDVFDVKKLAANLRNAGALSPRLVFRAITYLPRRLVALCLISSSYLRYRKKLVRTLRNVRMKYDRALVLAIDHTACYFAGKCFPGRVVFWSYDILSPDSIMRIKGGSLEKLITSQEALAVKALIVQDERREKLLEDSLGVRFPRTIYLPVSLNDSEFCRQAAEKRRKKGSLSTVRIVQNGEISRGRWSLALIEAYQGWPARFELTLRGFVYPEVKRKLPGVGRKPVLAESICDHAVLPQALDDYDIGFVGYAIKDGNHEYIENASSQMVEFLKLGIPVIACGSRWLNEFVTRQNIGMGIDSVAETENAVRKTVESYSFFSRNARELYESRFNLKSHFDNCLIKSFEPLL